MELLAAWERKLKERGIRYTHQRSIIIEALLKSEQPLSAQEIYARITDIDVKLKLSTVYRNLNYFVEENIVRRLHFDNKEWKFELVEEEHHHHLICVGCGNVNSLECPMKGFEDKVRTETDYQIVEHKMNIYGICPTCQH